LCSVCKCNLLCCVFKYKCYILFVNILYIVVCHFVPFLLAIALSVLLWLMASDYPLVIPLISLSCSPRYVLFVKFNLLCSVCKCKKRTYCVLFVNITCSFLFVIVIFSSFLFGCHGDFEVEIEDYLRSQI
jgi:hypothetical protein